MRFSVTYLPLSIDSISDYEEKEERVTQTKVEAWYSSCTLHKVWLCRSRRKDEDMG
jgi:hypothetical protein